MNINNENKEQIQERMQEYRQKKYVEELIT
jgi:hypothetical protein